MKVSTFVIAVGLVVVGCTGGPGEPFAGGINSTGSGSSSSSSSDQGGGTDTTSPTPAPTSTGGSSGSSTSTIIVASSFDQTCKVASDCTPVFQGSACSTCSCPNAAINSGAQSDYDAALSNARASCGPSSGSPCTTNCPNVTTLCAGGKCQVAIGIAADGG